MSDNKSKAEKLADGKKKLKKFQSKQKKPSTECLEQLPESENGSEEQASVPETEEVKEPLPVRRRTPPHRESLKDELFSLLDGEKSRILELEGQVREQLVEIDGLKRELQSGELRDQLHSHVQALNLLVAEKADLVASVTAFQTLARGKDQEIEELQAKLSASRHQVQDFKVEVTQLRESLARFEHTQQNLCSENENAREKLQHLTEKCEDLSEEASQASQKLLLKSRECSELTEALKARESELGLAQLRVEQLSAGDTAAADGKIEGMAQQRALLEEQVRELLTQVEKTTLERDQAGTQYQNYVSQLNRESAKMVQKLQETSQERDQLAKREAELVKHVGELERQLQTQIAQPQAQAPDPETSEALKGLEEALNEAQRENEELRILRKSLGESGESQKRDRAIIAELEMRIERLQDTYVDPSALNATLEGEKVAAARAVAQNVQLKAQLEEMQAAYVQMTHDKASLMDQLQSEQHLSREMRAQVEEVEGLRQKLHFKDEEMVRLTHENSELEKRTLLQSQELDRLRHCEMGQQTSSVLQTEVERQREVIARLEASAKGEEGGNEEPVRVVEEVNGVLPTEEAMQKLEERFRRTMDDIAELTEEKQRLEHLVTQLQGETETIGEYVTLYQTQRQLLKQREVEKDVQVQRIAADREEMKRKLVELNGLVELLLRQKNIDIPEGAEVNGDAQGAEEVPESVPEKPEGQSEETAEKILTLLSEIKTNNLNTSNLVVPPGVVHHCSCCSGKLITV